MKRCTKCKIEYPATTEYFYKQIGGKYGLHSQCKKCRKLYERKRYKTEHGRTTKLHSVRHFNQTEHGYLQHRYNNIKQRCENPNRENYKRYMGIELKFTLNEFRNYIKGLSVDIHELQIHRIDNSKHYTLDNIEFLTPEKHSQKHKNKT